MDLPKTFNTDRYLGRDSSQQQKAFHYYENFRVDNLQRDTHNHWIEFTLK